MPIYSSNNRKRLHLSRLTPKNHVRCKKSLPDAADTADTEAAPSNTPQDAAAAIISCETAAAATRSQRAKSATPAATPALSKMAEFDADAFADSLPGWDPAARAAFLASLDDDEAPELPLLAESVDEMDPAMVEALMQLRDGGEPPSELAVDAKERGNLCGNQPVS